ncbi:MAG: hypothetical protein HQK63_02050 [Desulfamplus sp.]|nr:hypothetical protein [Desulfamplus sp.]
MQNFEEGDNVETGYSEEQTRNEKECASKGVRYTMTHLGDIVVNALDKFWKAALTSTKGITLTYNIHELKHKKTKLQREIGERVAEIKEKSPELEIFDDDKLSKLFTELGIIEDNINASIYEREERLYPNKSMKEQCA